MALICTLDFEMAQRKLTNEELAKRAGVHKTSVSKLRRNLFVQIDAQVLEKICRELDLQPGDLLHIEPEEQ
jgi:DNA-binding Xre family transcriptional regulator